MNLLSFLLITVSSLRAIAPEESCTCKIEGSFPVPPASQQSLFYIQRTPNTNTIMYDLNLQNGVVDAEDPVHVYWLRYGEDGQKEELSFIQRRYAYGLKTKKVGGNRYELRFVSYKKLLFYLTLGRDNRYHIQATINGKQIDVSRVFLQIEGGTFWFPNVVCVEVRGTDPLTGKQIIQNFKP